MQRKFIIVFITLLGSLSLSGQDCRKSLQELADGEFASCIFGARFCYEDGTEIASCNPERKMMPASNMKVLTTAAALERLGEDYRWTTTLAISGEVDENGTLEGDLWILGGGDPAIGTAEKAVEQYFEQWLGIIASAGIRSISGRVVGDGSWLEGMRRDDSWEYSDLGTYYATCLSGLNFYQNRQDFLVAPGTAPGDSLTIEPAYPESPWMDWTFDCCTGQANTGDRLYLYTDAVAPCGILRGTLAVDKKPKTIHCCNNYPEYTLANEFCKFLQNNQIYVSGGPCMFHFPEGLSTDNTQLAVIDERPAHLQSIGSTTSPALLDIVKRTLADSDNFFAEMLFRTLGYETFGYETFGSTGSDKSAEALEMAVSGILANAGACVGAQRLAIKDGSGLSRSNYLSPSLMCDFLRGEMRSSHFNVFLSCLTPMGSRIRLKTGSFGGCRNLCGYILPAAGSTDNRTIVFSIMVNNSHLSVAGIDKIERNFLKTYWQ